MAQALKNLQDPVSECRVTYEEFLAQADEYVHAEWIDGEVIVLSPASDAHQDLVAFLTALLRVFAQDRQLGQVRPAPFQMKTAPDLPGREPDVLFLSQKHADRLRNSHLAGPADIAVEIVSRDSRARDRGDKFYEYEQGGVQEYWLLDPLRQQAEFYRRDDAAIFVLQPVDADGVFHSTVLEGFWLRVEWLWLKPLPTVISILKEWRLI